MTKVSNKLKLNRVIDIGVVITIIIIIYNIGYWKCSVDKNQEILALKQQLNVEMTDLTLKHQQELIELYMNHQSELSSIKAELSYLKQEYETKR